jgi:nucleotide-binding universal stress UspA family protein
MYRCGSVQLVLVADGTPATDAAARAIHGLIDPSAIARITIAAVGHPVTSVNGWVLGMLGVVGVVPQSLALGLREEDAVWARAEADRVAHHLGGIKPQAVTVTGSGDPVEEIIALARDISADLIVVGSTKHGRLARHDLASELVQRAKCPVLVVRPETEDPPVRGKRAPTPRYRLSQPSVAPCAAGASI